MAERGNWEIDMEPSKKKTPTSKEHRRSSNKNLRSKINPSDSESWDPLLASFPYDSHIFRDSKMGVGLGSVILASCARLDPYLEVQDT